MEKRKLILGTYDTARDGLWTLSALSLTDPDYQEYLLDVKGRDGPLDLSTVLTDGVPRYGPRTLTATLESSEGTRADRTSRIGKMINALDGMRMNIRHPDCPLHYLTGRVKVKVEYNDLAHAAVTVTAVCDPWLYSHTERVYTLIGSYEWRQLVLSNSGRRSVAPQIVVTGATATNSYFQIRSATLDVVLSSGTFILPELLLPPGDTLINCVAVGDDTVAKISYREAVLR